MSHQTSGRLTKHHRKANPVLRGTLSSRLSESQADASTPGSYSTETCVMCQKIANAVTATNKSWREVSLGTWREFLERRQCACCQRVVQHLEDCQPWAEKLTPSCRLRFVNVTNSFWLTSVSRMGSHPLPYYTKLPLQ